MSVEIPIGDAGEHLTERAGRFRLSLTNARGRRQLVRGSTVVLKGGTISDDRGVQLATRICALNTMKAVRAHKRGGPEVLRYEDAPVPEVGASEVLVEVHAAAVTPGELAWDETWVSVDGADRTPVVPSHEFSGVIARVGGDVSSLTPGSQVYGLIDFNHDGAAAEFVSLPQEAVVRRPVRLSHVESASLPLAALTAWQALSDRARLQPGERVFIQGGAGGVGSLAVQLAKSLGAEVTATASKEDEPLVTTLGADRVVPSVSVALSPGEPLFDVLLNTFGGPVPMESYGLVRPGGRLVTLAEPLDQSVAERHGVQGIFFVVSSDPGELRRIADLADEGKLRPVIARTFPLAEAAVAYGPPPTPRRPGKTVLVVSRNHS
jgi:NADPH:quinone reductase-like Zn-dependent oxidoreductase